MKILVKSLKSLNYKIATAESCTGGLVAKMITDVSGSSAVFEYGVVTYSNRAKTDLLGVSETTLATFGAVSEETAKEMALGALKLSGADIALSVTGVAGPEPSEGKPVGTVCIGVATKDKVLAKTFVFGGKRSDVRRQSAKIALNMALWALGETAKKQKLSEKAMDAMKKITNKIKKK
jgi:PncC family amidohydrolase